MDAPAQDLSSTSNKPNPLLTISLVVLLVFIGGAAYVLFTGSSVNSLFGFSRPQTTARPATSQAMSNLNPALKTAQQMIDNYAASNLLNKTQIEQVFSGKLKALNLGQNWTLERGGKSVVLNSMSGKEVEYFRGTFGSSARQEIKSSEIKVGDHLIVVTEIDIESGKTYVKRITVKTKASVATPSPSPTQ